MSKIWKIVVVLVLGASVHIPPASPTTGWSFTMHGPTLGIVLYGILALVALTKTLNHLPGTMALRHPLGVVRSGYEYLWGPAIIATVAGFTYSGVIEGRSVDARSWTITYGARHDSWQPLVALVVFALMMWSLKLHATMAEANRRIPLGPYPDAGGRSGALPTGSP